MCCSPMKEMIKKLGYFTSITWLPKGWTRLHPQKKNKEEELHAHKGLFSKRNLSRQHKWVILTYHAWHGEQLGYLKQHTPTSTRFCPPITHNTNQPTNHSRRATHYTGSTHTTQNPPLISAPLSSLPLLLLIVACFLPQLQGGMENNWVISWCNCSTLSFALPA